MQKKNYQVLTNGLPCINILSCNQRFLWYTFSFWSYRFQFWHCRYGIV